MLSTAEENYLKAIYKIAEKSDEHSASTNAIALAMQTSAASVTDMLKRLSEKSCVSYEKYRGVTLTESGRSIATALIRKHRLWEVFLLDKLGFAWDEVHELAEQLEHIQGDHLVDRLDSFLGFPRFDPHGDPIPDAQGHWQIRRQGPLSALLPGQSGVVTGVDDHSSTFLQYLHQIGLGLGVRVLLVERNVYDGALLIQVDDRQLTLSDKAGRNVLIGEN